MPSFNSANGCLLLLFIYDHCSSNHKKELPMTTIPAIGSFYTYGANHLIASSSS